MNKRVIDLEESISRDKTDYVMAYNVEPSPVGNIFTYKIKIEDLLALRPITVNGKSGTTIIVIADDIPDVSSTKKFTTATEKAKVALIKTDQGSTTYLAGDGSYQPVPVIPSGITTTTVVSTSTSTSLISTNNHLVITDTTSGALSIDLPLYPVNTQTVRVKDAGNAGTFNVTVNGNGKQIENTTSSIINTNFGAIEFVFADIVNKWLVVSFV
ncbi:hypothetical protein WBG78_28420 [Chryseolinea sp. T2]|uniref:hypothetical protein n=1 Tax=Chryseolinea sp. T2 TaxID=3129255 RepID=UPI003076DF12